MRRKHKLMLAAYCVAVSAAMGAITTSLVIKYPDSKVWIGLAAFVLYNLMLVVGVRRIVRLSKV